MLNINLNKYNIKEEETIIVGCSSGPDSMALLHYLRNNYNNKIVCAHINHNVRHESEKEEKYLKEYTNKNNIIFELYKINKYTENNFEAEARKKRYEFYFKLLNKYNSNYLFLAHHADDLIETILMKIERGSNLEGYIGIKEISFINDKYIIRPFLNYTKEDLLYYNKKYNIKYYIDKTNTDTKYKRNNYRANILPILKEINPNIHKYYKKFSNTLSEYNDYINYELKDIYNNIIINNKIELLELNKLHLFMKKNLLYKYLNNNYNNIPNIITDMHINNILNILDNKKPNIQLNMPQNKIIIKDYKYLYIKNDSNNNPNYKIEFNDTFNINNYYIEKIEDTEIDGNDICRLNSNELSLPIYIRNRKNGDYISLFKNNGTKKVKDIFIDKKIEKDKRNNYPILVDNNDNILWLPNLKKSKFNKQKNEFYDIILRYYEKEENNEQ